MPRQTSHAAASTLPTIAAIATPSGKGGIGIIRISGDRALTIGQAIVDRALRPRHAHFCAFYGRHGSGRHMLDQGIAIFFPGPHSFTGEDVVELQGHGGPVVLDLLLQEAIHRGAELARPGQFSERAFLNDKIDLAQAEAIADLINSSSDQAARSALQSLQGAFSQRVEELSAALTALRCYVEASIDFPEEEIDFLSDGKIAGDLDAILDALEQTLQAARQGAILRDGMAVVIAGKPNAGKSSLLNALTDSDSAIVSAIEGTTRDVLREHIQIDGMPVHIIDTAGLRDEPGEIEKMGIERAWREIRNADRILLVCDSALPAPSPPEQQWPEFFLEPESRAKITLVLNKCDRSGLPPGVNEQGAMPAITLSAKTGAGLPELRSHLKTLMGYSGGEGRFTARRRHLVALAKARDLVLNGRQQFERSGAGELLADDLYHAQQALGEITGKVHPDELLGKIFSSFCIGK